MKGMKKYEFVYYMLSRKMPYVFRSYSYFFISMSHIALT